MVWMRSSVPLALLALVLSLALTSVGTPSRVTAINQTDPTTIVYLDNPTINGTAIGVNNNVTVSIMIRNANSIYSWQAGLSFNSTLLNCTGFFEGEFLKSVSQTIFVAGTINNTAGMVRPPYACSLMGNSVASGSGRLAYATFKVKAIGVSDVHLSDYEVLDYNLNLVPVDMIDVYTVIVGTTSHTVFMVSNLTGSGIAYATRFYDHAFNPTLNETSFKVGVPSNISVRTIFSIYGSFCNVTIPKALLPSPEPPRMWAVLINGKSLSADEITVTENATHTSLYFTVPAGISDVQITTRLRSSNISMSLSEASISLGSSVTISGSITPVRPNVKVTVYNRTKGATTWDTIANVTTNQNSVYNCTWKPGKKGTYEVMASWGGDNITLRADSGVSTLSVTVKGGGIPILEVVAIVVVAIIVIAAIVVYFVKIRKPKPKPKPQ
jgi:hypothetical protein